MTVGDLLSSQRHEEKKENKRKQINNQKSLPAKNSLKAV